MITERSDRLAYLLTLLGGLTWWDGYLIVEPSRTEKLRAKPGQAHQALPGAVDTDSASLLPITGPVRNGDNPRHAYREALLDFVVGDLARSNLSTHMPKAESRLAELTNAVFEAALALARRGIDPKLRVDFAIIVMGKYGVQKLSYVPDIDVLYAVGAEDGAEEREAVEVDTRLAAMVAQIRSGPGVEQPL